MSETCKRCGALLGYEASHDRWRREQDQVNRMVVRGVWAKLRLSLVKVTEAARPPSLLVKRWESRDD